jgi:hypothetical protein
LSRSSVAAATPAFAIVLSLALSACVFPGVPSKPGAGDADFRRDEAACRAQAVTAAPQTYDPATGQRTPDAYVVTRSVRQCLEAQGWHLPPGVVLPL